MGSSLARPCMVEARERVQSDTLLIGSCCMNGSRETMEDAHIVSTKGNIKYFSIFDGHGGSDCANFVAKRLQDQFEGTGLCDDTRIMDDEEITQLMLGVDAEWRSVDSDQSGATCTSCFVTSAGPGQEISLKIVNSGDSRTLTVSNGKCTFATDDHKPENPEERARIEAAGGFVGNGRVCGNLAVSRGFGDCEFKKVQDPHKHEVTVIPDITVAKMRAIPRNFLVLCCDGVFERDVFNNDSLAEFIDDAVANNGGDLADAAASVCRTAIERGSGDNISCMIVAPLIPGLPIHESFAAKPTEVMPGSCNMMHNGKFRAAFEHMCLVGGVTAGRAIEMRYDFLASNQLEVINSTDLLEEWKFMADIHPPELPADPSQDDVSKRTQHFQRWFQGKDENLMSNSLEASNVSPLNVHKVHPTAGGVSSIGPHLGVAADGRSKISPDPLSPEEGGPPRVEQTPPPQHLQGFSRPMGHIHMTSLDSGSPGGGLPSIPDHDPSWEARAYPSPSSCTPASTPSSTPDKLPSPSLGPSSARPSHDSHDDDDSVVVEEAGSSSLADEECKKTGDPVVDSIEETMSRIRATLDRSKRTSESIESSLKGVDEFQENWQKFQGMFGEMNAALARSLENNGMGVMGDGSDKNSRLTAEEKAAALNGKRPTLEAIVDLIAKKKVKNVVVCAGAGLSTSAGIPDFRSKETGLYAQLAKQKEQDKEAAKEGDKEAAERLKSQWDLPSPESLFTIDFYRNNPYPFINRLSSIWPGEGTEIRPTPGHAFIRMLHEKYGALRRVYTQNIDGLEKIAGIPADRVVQCHGSFDGLGCSAQCGYKVPRYTSSSAETETSEYAAVRKSMVEARQPVICPACKKAPLKPDIVFFGESLPKSFSEQLEEDLPKCDLLIVVGTSLQVMPFSSIPARVHPAVPRLLLNMDPAGCFCWSAAPGNQADNYRDVHVLADIDSSSFHIASMLGATKSLRMLCKVIGCKAQSPTVTNFSQAGSVTKPATSSKDVGAKEGVTRKASGSALKKTPSGRKGTPPPATRKTTPPPAGGAKRTSPPPAGRRSSSTPKTTPRTDGTPRTGTQKK